MNIRRTATVVAIATGLLVGGATAALAKGSTWDRAQAKGSTWDRTATVVLAKGSTWDRALTGKAWA